MRAFKRPELIPIAEAAKRLGCSVRTLQRIARDGGISFVRRGRFAHVLREDLSRLEVDGRTDWLIARLAGPEADDMLVGEWFRQWMELQRLVSHGSPAGDLQASLAVAEFIIEQDGGRTMSQYGVGDLATTLESSELVSEQAIGLRILAHWPGSPPLLTAYRAALRSLAGWSSPVERPSGRRGRARNGWGQSNHGEVEA